MVGEPEAVRVGRSCDKWPVAARESLFEAARNLGEHVKVAATGHRARAGSAPPRLPRPRRRLHVNDRGRDRNCRALRRAPPPGRSSAKYRPSVGFLTRYTAPRRRTPPTHHERRGDSDRRSRRSDQEARQPRGRGAVGRPARGSPVPDRSSSDDCHERERRDPAVAEDAPVARASQARRRPTLPARGKRVASR